MAEAMMNANEAADLRDAARLFDRARMQQIGGFHFAMVMGALTMWGAAETWAQVTGWGLAHFAAVGNAIVAGFVITSTIHEWGHFAGARLSGSVSPVLDQPKRHFFLFNFAMDQNDTHQFTWMSWGGILAPWLAVVVALIFVPLTMMSGKVLLATLVMRAVSIAVFEVPVVQGAAQSGDPGAALSKQTMAGGLARGRRIGTAVGVAFFVLLWMAV